jgi:tRNA A37 threonylcarbamoyladenosine modification protein TsaB
VILVIDTSSSRSALAVIDPAGRGDHDLIFGSRDPMPLDARLRDAIPELKTIAKVVIATGPGSFTGLRRGASFGVGLAMGLKVPLVPLPTLGLQAARGRGRFTAISEAGRGRFYRLAPGAEVGLGSPDEIPKEHELVGLVSSTSQAQLEVHGLKFAADREVRTVAEAAEELLKSAREVPYGSVKLEYMQSFGAKF